MHLRLEKNPSLQSLRRESAAVKLAGCVRTVEQKRVAGMLLEDHKVQV